MQGSRCSPMLAVVAALVLVAAAATQQRVVQYVVLEGGGPDQGPGGDVDANFAEVAAQFDVRPAAAARQLACGVQQLRILSRAASVVRRDVEHALDLAERHRMPVFLHVDSCYGWGAGTETDPADAPAQQFWREVEMREWDRWPEGDGLPTDVPRPWLCWGPWCTPAPAVPAFGAPRLVAFAVSQLELGVLAPLRERLTRWRGQGREHLFAGINVAWEAHVPDFGEPGFRRQVQEAGGAVRAEYPVHERGVAMDPELVGRQLGHASLHWRGYDESKVAAAAAAAGVSRDEQFRRLCYDVLHDYQRALCEACHRSGLPRHRVFTHVVALATVGAPRTTRPPVRVAVNEFSTPGFTLDNRGGARFDLVRLREDLLAADPDGGGRFAAVESYFALGGRVYAEEPQACRRELEQLFAAGARVQVFYGSFPLAKRMPPAASAALTAWLADAEPSRPDTGKLR